MEILCSTTDAFRDNLSSEETRRKFLEDKQQVGHLLCYLIHALLTLIYCGIQGKRKRCSKRIYLSSKTSMWRLIDCDSAKFSAKKRPLRSISYVPSLRSGCISSLSRSKKKKCKLLKNVEQKKKPAPHLFLLAQHRAFARGGSRGCPCFLLPPSLHPSPSFLLNRCQRWVKSSPEGPASSILVYN